MSRPVSSPAESRSQGAGKLVVTHGGAEAFRYRNVLQALDEALACGADMFEFDVRRVADGALVVHHDPDVGTRPLAALDYEAAAREAALLGYRLPRLREVLDRARGRLRLDVELKEAGYEDAIVREVMSGGFPLEDFVVTSFEAAAIQSVRKSHPEVRTGLLVYDVTGPEALAIFQRFDAAFLGPDHHILDAATLHQADLARIPLLPWTVNDPAAMRRLLRAPAVTGLITDRPAEALRIRKEETQD